MTDYHKYCIRIETNIEVLKILEMNNISNNNYQYESAIQMLEKSIKSIYSTDKLTIQHFKNIENSLLNIQEGLKLKKDSINYFIYQVIKVDSLYIKSNYFKSIIFDIKNNINNYLRESPDNKELSFDHIEMFNQEEFMETFKKENEYNKNKNLTLNLFQILISIIEEYKKIDKDINEILKSI